ncbi:MAG: AsmA family protein [Candidatus Omnitrophica bacterium ADurb.Bin277]|nr:MAG: AsmA family protein [Candidatus Omnitrophica bacterium ADurb.Bin277]
MVLRKILKFISDFFLLVLVLIMILGISGFFLAKTVDPNIFRSELEKHLTQKTGLRVELGNIRFSFGLRIRLALDTLKFYNPKSLEKLLQSDSVVMETDLWAIIRKKFWIPLVRIENPEVFIKRRVDGNWNWQRPDAGTGADGHETALSVSSTPVPTEKFPGRLARRDIGFGKIEIDDGTIHYADETVQPAFVMDIVKCDAEVISAPPLSAVHLSMTASVWNGGEKKIALEGEWDTISRSLDLSFRYDRDRISFKGIMRLIRSLPRFEGAVQVRELDLGSAMLETYQKGEYVAGILNADLRFSSDGGNPAILMRSLAGSGSIRIRDGAIKNRNLIKEILEKTSPVIAVAALVEGEIPAEMTGMMQGPDTDFQKTTVDFSVENGVVSVNNFLLMHPDYQLDGTGTHTLHERKVDISSSLVFSKSISEYFVKKIHELKAVRDRNGLVTIPFRCMGTLSDVVVVPDLPYISSRIVQVGAQELLTKSIERLMKLLEPKTSEQTQTGTAVEAVVAPSTTELNKDKTTMSDR